MDENEDIKLCSGEFGSGCIIGLGKGKILDLIFIDNKEIEDRSVDERSFEQYNDDVKGHGETQPIHVTRKKVIKLNQSVVDVAAMDGFGFVVLAKDNILLLVDGDFTIVFRKQYSIPLNRLLAASNGTFIVQSNNDIFAFCIMQTGSGSGEGDSAGGVNVSGDAFVPSDIRVGNSRLELAGFPTPSSVSLKYIGDCTYMSAISEGGDVLGLFKCDVLEQLGASFADDSAVVATKAMRMDLVFKHDIVATGGHIAAAVLTSVLWNDRDYVGLVSLEVGGGRLLLRDTLIPVTEGETMTGGHMGGVEEAKREIHLKNIKEPTDFVLLGECTAEGQEMGHDSTTSPFSSTQAVISNKLSCLSEVVRIDRCTDDGAGGGHKVTLKSLSSISDVESVVQGANWPVVLTTAHEIILPTLPLKTSQASISMGKNFDLEGSTSFRLLASSRQQSYETQQRDSNRIRFSSNTAGHVQHRPNSVGSQRSFRRPGSYRNTGGFLGEIGSVSISSRVLSKEKTDIELLIEAKNEEQWKLRRDTQRDETTINTDAMISSSDTFWSYASSIGLPSSGINPIKKK